MSIKKRSFTRHPIALRVRVRTPAGWTEMTTVDVSRRGLYLRTDQPLAEHRIAQLRLSMPSGKEIDAMGHVRRVVRDDTDGLPGMGIEFFVMSKEAEDEWDRFVLEQSRMAGEEHGGSVVTLRDSSPAEIPPPRYKSAQTVAQELVMELPVIRQTMDAPLPRARRAAVQTVDEATVVASGGADVAELERARGAVHVVTGGQRRDEHSRFVAEVMAETESGASGLAPLPSVRRVAIEPARQSPAATVAVSVGGLRDGLSPSSPLVALEQSALPVAASATVAAGTASRVRPPPIPEPGLTGTSSSPPIAQPRSLGSLHGSWVAPPASAGDGPHRTSAEAPRPASARDSSPARPATLPSAPAADGLFLTIRPAAVEHLRQLIERRIRLAGVFLRSQLYCHPGQPVDVAVVHPLTDAELLLSGTVAKVMRGEEESENGFLLRFGPISDEFRDTLLHFVATGEPEVQAPTAMEAQPIAVLLAEAQAHPDDPMRWLRLGRQLLVDDGSAVDAIEALQQALAAGPERAEVHEALALAYALAGDRAKSLAFLRSAHQLWGERSP